MRREWTVNKDKKDEKENMNLEKEQTWSAEFELKGDEAKGGKRLEFRLQSDLVMKDVTIQTIKLMFSQIC